MVIKINEYLYVNTEKISLVTIIKTQGVLIYFDDCDEEHKLLLKDDAKDKFIKAYEQYLSNVKKLYVC